MPSDQIILISGYGRSGKDTLGRFIGNQLQGFPPISTSAAACRAYWQALGGETLPPKSLAASIRQGMFDDIHDFYARRGDHRAAWADFIDQINKASPSGIGLYEEMVREGDRVLVGIRRIAEWEAAKKMFKPVITLWVFRPKTPPDPTCEVKSEHCDCTVPNVGTVADLEAIGRDILRIIR